MLQTKLKRGIIVLTIEINKSFFIKIGIVIVLCVGCFFLGRCTAFNSKTEHKLIDALDDLSETNQAILKDLQDAGCSIEAAQDYADLFISILQDWSEANKKLEDMSSQMTDISRAQGRLIENMLSVYEKAVDEQLDALDIIIEKATEYERLLKEYMNEKDL